MSNETTTGILSRVLDLFIGLLRYLHLVKEREKDDAAAEYAGDKIKEKADGIKNPKTSPSDPLGTDAWNEGK